MAKRIKIADGLSVPESVATQPIAILGRRGSGKTYAAGSLVERLLEHDHQVVILDPVSNWWALRLTKSGKRASKFDIPVLGGPHGDIPLEATGGSLVAEFVIGTGSSAVLDLIEFNQSEKRRFVADFTEKLISLKSRSPSPIHIVLEEAQEFAPQHAGKGTERMLGAMQRLVKLGRNWGIGVTMITQRPQAVHKEVLNQAEPLIVGQMTAPHERKAVKDWVSYVGAEANVMLDTLPGLKPGDMWFWSPSWMDGVFKQIRFLEKKTYDASATPTGARGKFIDLAPVDLVQLQAHMSDTVERVRASDPKHLKKAIAERDKTIATMKRDHAREIAKLQKQSDAVVEQVDIAKVVQPLVEAIAAARLKHDQAGDAIDAAIRASLDIHIDQPKPRRGGLLKTPVIGHETKPAAPKKRAYVKKNMDVSDERAAVSREMTSTHVKVIDAVYFWMSVNCNNPDRSMVAFMAGLSPSSGHIKNILGALKSAGYVEYPSSGRVCLTDAGAGIARGPGGLIGIGEYQDLIYDQIDKIKTTTHTRIIRWLIENAPPGESATREEVAEANGLSIESGHIKNILSSLKSIGLVEYPQSGCVCASDLAFANGILAHT